MGDIADDLIDAMIENDEWTPYVQCAHCKRHGFVWGQSSEDGKYRLYTPSGRVHYCKKYQP